MTSWWYTHVIVPCTSFTSKREYDKWLLRFQIHPLKYGRRTFGAFSVTMRSPFSNFTRALVWQGPKSLTNGKVRFYFSYCFLILDTGENSNVEVRKKNIALCSSVSAVYCLNVDCFWRASTNTNFFWRTYCRTPNFQARRRLLLLCLKHDSGPICKESTLFFICCRKVAGMNTLMARFHMIADDRGSRIADRKKFCDRLRSYVSKVRRNQHKVNN